MKYNLESMAAQVSQDLRDLIVNFVRTYSNAADLELDLHLHPQPSFMPLSSDASKKEASHYFLLAAALGDYQLTGNPRNIQLLLSHLLEVFGRRLYTITNSAEFKREVDKFERKIENLDRLGKEKAEISEVLCSVNQFVAQKAQGDLIDYTTKLSEKGRKPKDFVQTLSYSVKRMNKQHKSKCWLYLRWMVRGQPDLGLFKFNPKDLMVSLTTPKFRVYVALGLSEDETLPFKLNSKNKPDSWWENTAEFDADAEKLTQFAKSLFPEDPAKIDFPFFILGNWLEFSDLTPISLERSLRFFIQKSQELFGPLMRYLTVVYHYNRIGERIEPGAFTLMEKEVYDFLREKQLLFYYEFMEFYLPQDNSDGSITYKPDFLLPQLTCGGKKLLLEPHGVKSDLFKFLDKLRIFRQHFGDYFCVVLIVPDDQVEIINVLDQEYNAFDFLWKRTNFRIQLENFHST
jgi:hypothetical protein